MSAILVNAPRVRTRKPVARTIRLLSPGRVVTTVGGVDAEYTLAEFSCGGAYDGRAFQVEKLSVAL